MIIRYPINTASQYEAIELAKSLAKTHGFRMLMVLSVRRESPTSWTITLDASK